jgi:hypothetical protein
MRNLPSETTNLGQDFHLSHKASRLTYNTKGATEVTFSTCRISISSRAFLWINLSNVSPLVTWKT